MVSEDNPWIHKSPQVEVLILVLVEDGLGEYKNNPTQITMAVLILVLVEDGLGA